MTTTSLALKATRKARSRTLMQDDILSAARDILHNEGISALSMRALGRAVGVTAPTLYDYFASKEAVLDALFAEGVCRLKEGMDMAVCESQPGAPALMGIATAYRDFAKEDSDLFRLVLGRIDADYCPSDALKEEAGTLYQPALLSITAAIELGQFPSGDPELLTTSVWAMLHGWVTLEIDGHLKNCAGADLEHAFQDAMGAYFSALGTGTPKD